jgi:HAD superfamily hydrolase (TIGR01509 family)
VYRNLIWDLDGTLFDTYPAIAGAYRDALLELGGEAELAWIERLARHSLSYCSAMLAEAYHLDGTRLDQGFKIHYSRVAPEQQPPMPGALDLCRFIWSQCGKNVIVTHRDRASSLELLAVYQMDGFFVGSITGDDGYPRKPDPASMNAALRLFGLERRVTLAIGDREIDIAAGKAAGVATCLYGGIVEETVADYHVNNYGELDLLLNGNP